MLQIYTLLKAVSVLLLLVSTQNVPQELKDQANQIALQAIALTQVEMVQLSQTNMTDTQPTQTPNPVPAPAPSTTAQATAPASQARIEIISTSRNHRIDSTHVATNSQGDLDDDNVMDIAALVYDDNGNPVTTGLATVETTDPSQNKQVYASKVNDQIYFPFQYVFRTAGDNTVTFKMNGLEKSVTVTAQ